MVLPVVLQMPSLWTLCNISSPLLKAFNYLIRQSDDGAVNRTLANIFEQTVKANVTPVNGVATFDAAVDSALGVWVRLFVPTQVWAPSVTISHHPNLYSGENSLWFSIRRKAMISWKVEMAPRHRNLCVCNLLLNGILNCVCVVDCVYTGCWKQGAGF